MFTFSWGSRYCALRKDVYLTQLHTFNLTMKINGSSMEPRDKFLMRLLVDFHSDIISNSSQKLIEFVLGLFLWPEKGIQSNLRKGDGYILVQLTFLLI